MSGDEPERESPNGMTSVDGAHLGLRELGASRSSPGSTSLAHSVAPDLDCASVDSASDGRAILKTLLLGFIPSEDVKVDSANNAVHAGVVRKLPGSYPDARRRC